MKSKREAWRQIHFPLLSQTQTPENIVGFKLRKVCILLFLFQDKERNREKEKAEREEGREGG